MNENIFIPQGENFAWVAKKYNGEIIEEFIRELNGNGRNSIPELNPEEIEIFSIVNGNSEFGFDVKTGEFILKKFVKTPGTNMETTIEDSFKFNVMLDDKEYVIGENNDNVKFDGFIMYRTAMQVVEIGSLPAISGYHVGFKKTYDKFNIKFILNIDLYNKEIWFDFWIVMDDETEAQVKIIHNNNAEDVKYIPAKFEKKVGRNFKLKLM